MDYMTEVKQDNPLFLLRHGDYLDGAGTPYNGIYNVFGAEGSLRQRIAGVSGSVVGATDPLSPIKDGWPIVIDSGAFQPEFHCTTPIGFTATWDEVGGPAPGRIETVTLEFWLWWSAFADDDKYAFEYSAQVNDSGFGCGFSAIPNDSGSSKFKFGCYDYTDAFTRPTEDAWHHYVLVMTRGASPSNVAYVDGASVSLTTVSHASSNGYIAEGESLTGFRRNGMASGYAPDHSYVDAVALYPRALSAAQVAAHYTAATVGTVGISQSGAFF